MSKRIALFASYSGMLSNAMAFTIAFPFGSHMVQQFGMASDRSSTGFWVGLLAFGMMSGRMLASPVWGYIIDRFGRRVSMLIGLAAICMFSASFGMSSSYWWALWSRVLIGMLCCCSLAAITLVTDMTKADPGAIAWVMTSWQTGNILGNVIGGVFSDPNEKGYTDLDLFESFPFLLPNLVVVLLSFVTLVLAVIYVPETLNKSCEKATNSVRGYKELLKDTTLLWVLLQAFVWNTVLAGFHELIALWLWARKEDGGFTMTTSEIGAILGISAFILIIVENAILSMFRKYFDIVTILRSLNLIGAMILFMVPFAEVFNHTVYVKYIAIGVVCFFWWMTAFSSISCITVMQNNCVINPERGRMMGMAMVFVSGAKALGPLGLGSCFAATAREDFSYPVNYSLSFNLMGSLLVLSYFFSLNCPKSLNRPFGEPESIEKPLLAK